MIRGVFAARAFRMWQSAHWRLNDDCQRLTRRAAICDSFSLNRGYIPIKALQQLLPIAPEESGWEDTFTVNPRENMKILVRFDQFAGRFVWHCHILEHEDHEMMRPLEVLAPEPSALALAGMAIALYSRAFLARRAGRILGQARETGKTPGQDGRSI
jgi:hypothetical protein